VPEGPILAAEPRLAPIQLFIILQPAKNIEDDRLVHVKFHDVVADVLLAGIAEKLTGPREVASSSTSFSRPTLFLMIF